MNLRPQLGYRSFDFVVIDYSANLSVIRVYYVCKDIFLCALCFPEIFNMAFLNIIISISVIAQTNDNYELIIPFILHSCLRYNFVLLTFGAIVSYIYYV